ncbi:GIY-YIG nuclease family protein [Flavobacterium sp.]|uniref:GIY-YIG nuclease family protein n=1 Tax=Flavobacterium sp. TaxID=239 RepID=UPI00286B0FE1|nr:GIY-YIG nuclease family protein [Flavobacterium sp.]
MMKPAFIYIITNKYQTTVYTDVTSNLPQRIMEHKEKRYPNSFSARYSLNILVYYEQFASPVRYARVNGLEMRLLEKNKLKQVQEQLKTS